MPKMPASCQFQAFDQTVDQYAGCRWTTRDAVPANVTSTLGSSTRPAAPAGAHASPRTGAAVVVRGYADLVEPASVLIMNSPVRSVLARRDRDRAGCGEKRAPDTESEVDVPVIGGVPVAD